MTTTRRDALGAGVLCAGALLLGGRMAVQRLVQPPPDPDYRTLAERIARIPRDRAHLYAVGIAYVQGVEHPPNSSELAKSCFPSVEERDMALSLPVSRLLEVMERKANEDYRHGRVESVQGWLLSQTEACFAGIVARLQYA